jgi:UDP-N-acetylglucosamine 1-carboxyvinyltransferase
MLRRSASEHHAPHGWRYLTYISRCDWYRHLVSDDVPHPHRHPHPGCTRHQGPDPETELADLLGTSQSAVARIEQGKQNLSLEMLARIGEARQRVRLPGHSGPQHLRIVGGQKLSGSIPVKTSKNAAVALLCASLLNKGRTTLRSLARIEEVNRIIEVLTSIGVKVRWLPGSNDLEIIPPARSTSTHRRRRRAPHPHGHHVPRPAAARARLSFQLPYAGGCDLGTRTIEPHLSRCKPFGLDVAATHGFYEATADAGRGPRARRSSSPSAATRSPRTSSWRQPATRAHDHPQRLPNYMVQDLCFFLQRSV